MESEVSKSVVYIVDIVVSQGANVNARTKDQNRLYIKNFLIFLNRNDPFFPPYISYWHEAFKNKVLAIIKNLSS